MPRLPDPSARRPNQGKLPTSVLPINGRAGDPPDVPEWITLGEAGLAWWEWAWRTPQAAAWSSGDVVTVARRASMEDDLAALDVLESPGLDELLGESAKQVTALLRRMQSLAGGRASISRAMLDIEDRLGVTPKSRAALRWTIVDDLPVAGVDRQSDAAFMRESRKARILLDDDSS